MFPDVHVKEGLHPGLPVVKSHFARGAAAIEESHIRFGRGHVQTPIQGQAKFEEQVREEAKVAETSRTQVFSDARS